MKERPILFSAPMVCAILADTKTQTRRAFPNKTGLHSREPHHCPYGQPGDRLWVRETFCPIYPQDPDYNAGKPIAYDYAASYQHGDRLGDSLGIKKKWKPSIHMPRIASRITLEITSVRVERLRDISEADAQAEGCALECMTPTGDDRGSAIYGPSGFKSLWESIYGSNSWSDNPWVWVVDFRRVWN